VRVPSYRSANKRVDKEKSGMNTILPLAFLLGEEPPVASEESGLISDPTGSGYPPEDDPDD